MGFSCNTLTSFDARDLSRQLNVPRIQNKHLKRQSDNCECKSHNGEMLAPPRLIEFHFIVCVENI